jgi:hypothetical protein
MDGLYWLCFAYLYFKENIPIDVKVFGRFDLLTLLLFLPNMHFWTASLGKGSMIFMGLMLFTHAVKFPQKRILGLVNRWFFYLYGETTCYAFCFGRGYDRNFDRKGKN